MPADSDKDVASEVYTPPTCLSCDRPVGLTATFAGHGALVCTSCQIGED